LSDEAEEERQERTRKAAAALRQEQEQQFKWSEMPSLKKLVEQHGSYDKIPETAWAEYWQKMDDWKRRWLYR